MLDKYFRLMTDNIVSGQDAKTGMWYCKELPAKNTNETDCLIGELNRIYNKYNKEIERNNKKKVEIKK